MKCPYSPEKSSVRPINKFVNKVTVYNDIPSDGVNLRRFDRHIIDKCLTQRGYTERTDGTMQNNINAITIITKDVDRYKSPTEYKQLAIDEKENYYTVQIDDFVVLSEVDDVVTTSKEFQALQQKYKDNGFLVTMSNPNIHGMGVDNIEIVHA